MICRGFYRSTYLLFAAIARLSIPLQQGLAFFVNSFPNFLSVSERKNNVWIRQLVLRTPATCALRCGTHSCCGHLVPIHTEKIQKNTGASILMVSETKVHVPPSQIIDLRCQNIDAWMIKTRPSVSTPLIGLQNGCCLRKRGHHSKQAPGKRFARHSPVIVAAGNCKNKHCISYTVHRHIPCIWQ